ncbi:MAG: tRNA pseudouridine(13) synthase TruD [Planctomycetes bacterium]|nr:tRNA pseudouridine(13) synthase TruD [Planctomycetota bacterium]
MREDDDDFVVEELLAYEPCGEGTHRFFQIEKRGRTTFDVLRQIARTLGRKESDIGCAGLKDKYAVTRQWLSLEFATEDELRGLDIDGVSVLDVVPHKNKLKLGHLRGNRFVIVLRDVAPGDLERCEAKLEVLRARGVPNAFGPQRFGNTGSTPELGRRLLRDDAEGFLRAFAGASESDTVASMLDNARDRMLRRALEAWARSGAARDGLRTLPKRFLSLCVSALQSAVFNEVLSRRLAEDAISIDHVVAGDIAFLHRNGACFAVTTEEEAIAAAPRVAGFEISPSAPLPGPDCLRATGAVLETEDDVLARFDVRHEDFGVRRPWGQKGGRRALRVPLEACSVAAVEPTALELRFALPRGSFATAVTAELFT